MLLWRERFPFDLVLMLGDNIYDSHTAADYRSKFEEPYKALLEAGVTFQAAIGNHDDANQVHYQKFNMGGQRYYSFRRREASIQGGIGGAGARFWALDSRTLDPEQLAWLAEGLKESGSRWKIVFFHHPIYTSGRYTAGASSLRRALEPVLVNGDADVVLSGHEHFYERTHPQRGIFYFVSGAAGSLRPRGHQERRAHGARVRYRLQLHADGDCGRRVVLPGDFARGADGGRRRAHEGQLSTRPQEGQGPASLICFTRSLKAAIQVSARRDSALT